MEMEQRSTVTAEGRGRIGVIIQRTRRRSLRKGGSEEDSGEGRRSLRVSSEEDSEQGRRSLRKGSEEGREGVKEEERYLRRWGSEELREEGREEGRVRGRRNLRRWNRLLRQRGTVSIMRSRHRVR